MRHGWLVLMAVASLAAAPGRRLTLNLRGVEIGDALTMIAQQSGLNVVASRGVSGPVTLYVKDLDIRETLDLLAFANGLAYEQRGDRVCVMTAAEYEQLYGSPFQDRRQVRAFALRYAKAAQMVGLLEQLKSAIGRIAVHEPSNTLVATDTPASLERMAGVVAQADRPTQTRLFVLHYADAATAREQIAPWLTAGAGAAIVDARTNQLAVTDAPEVLDLVEPLLAAFDEQTRAVLIEAKIIQVTLTDEFSLGIDWQGVFREAQARTRARFTTLGDVFGGAAGSVFAWTGGGGDLTALVDAIRKVGRTEILSSPRIAALDRQEAKILVGTKEAFVTTTTVTPGGGSPATTAEQVTFVDVGVQLFVTPVIRRDGYVTLQIRPEVSAVERQLETAQGNKIPIVRTSEAETQVLVQDGTTLIIAGLIEDRRERSRSQVPVLGSVPVVGEAFGGRTRTAKKTETVIFLTPRLLPAAAPLPSGEPALLLPSADRQRALAMDAAARKALEKPQP